MLWKVIKNDNIKIEVSDINKMYKDNKLDINKTRFLYLKGTKKYAIKTIGKK